MANIRGSSKVFNGKLLVDVDVGHLPCVCFVRKCLVFSVAKGSSLRYIFDR